MNKFQPLAQLPEQLRLIVILLAGVVALPAIAFEQVEAETFGKRDFVFPQDIGNAGPDLLFLSMATDQDNGEYQNKVLLDWHKALQSRGVIPDRAMPWHFPIMESPPFFVKGLIKRGIAKSFSGLLPEHQGAVLFIDDLDTFATAANIPADGQATIVVYADGMVQEVFKGELTEQGVSEIIAALDRLDTPSAEVPQSSN